MVDIMLPLITCIFVVFDLASGGVAACANHEWKSSEMRKGLYHKFGSIMLVVLAYLIDYAQKYVDLGFQVPIAAGVCVYIILMELGSIVENIGKINIDIGASNPNNEHEYLNTKDAWDSRVKDSKKELEQLGFNIRGIMRADYTQEKTATGEKYCMTYYDYSDGLGISKQFSLTRKFMNGLNLSEFKLWIDECISKKGFYPICTHGTEELNVNINEIIDYIISSGGVITTYRDVYDAFKSTKIEEKILSIEKRLN